MLFCSKGGVSYDRLCHLHKACQRQLRWRSSWKRRLVLKPFYQERLRFIHSSIAVVYTLKCVLLFPFAIKVTVKWSYARLSVLMSSTVSWLWLGVFGHTNFGTLTVLLAALTTFYHYVCLFLYYFTVKCNSTQWFPLQLIRFIVFFCTLVQSNSPVSELPFTVALFDSVPALLTCTDVIHAALQRSNNSNNIAKRELLFPAD